MRIDGYNGSLYPHQAPSSIAPGVDKEKRAEERNAPKEVNVKADRLCVEKKSLLERLREQAQADWRLARDGAGKLFERGSELAKKVWGYLKVLFRKLEELMGNLGNYAQLEQKQAEKGVSPLTWQQSFKMRIQVLFETASDFLTSHLPMNHGNFFGPKDEKKRELPDKKEDDGKKRFGADPKNTNGEGSTFDMRG